MLSSFYLFAQQTPQLTVQPDTVIGKNILTGQDIIAQQYATPEKIYRWHLPETDNLILELRTTDKKGKNFKNEGYLTSINLSDKSTVWSRDVNYKNSEIENMSGNIFLKEKNKNYLLDPITGNNKWESKTFFYFIEPRSNIGVGYPLSALSNKLYAIDLNTGQELWDAKLDRTYGWDDAYMYNDSMLLIAMNGLNAYDLQNGYKWNYSAKTTKKEIGKLIATNVAGAILGAVTGVGFYKTVPDVATDMVSNIFIDEGGDMVLASRDKISRMDTQGNVLWSTELPEKTTSKSSLFAIDSTIYMINRGYAKYNGDFSMIGDPYFAAFNKFTGNQLYMNLIPEKKEFIRNFQVINNVLFIVFENKIATYSLSNGALLKEQVMDLTEDEELEAFIESGVFVRQPDSSFVDVLEINPQMNYVFTNKNRVLSVNDSLQVSLVYDKDQVFTHTLDLGDFHLLQGASNSAYIVNNRNIPLMKIDNKYDMFFRNGSLYVLQDKLIREINLDQLR